MGGYNFLNSVSLQQKFVTVDQSYNLVTVQLNQRTSDIAQLQLSLTGGPVFQLGYVSVLFNRQRKVHPRGLRAGSPREEVSCSIWLLFLFVFLLPLILPYVNWASQEGCLFQLRFSVWSSNLPLFHFCGLLPSLSFSHRHFGLTFPYSNYLTFPPSRDGRLQSLRIGAVRSLWLLPAELRCRKTLGLPLLLVSSLRVLTVEFI